MKLSGKTILITGAARRLGKALALACAQEGADLLLHYNSSSSEVDELSRQIGSLGCKTWQVKADLGDPDQVETLIETAASIPNFYALVNNASIFKSMGFLDTSLPDWNEHLRINLTAPFLLTQSFARSYTLAETGRVLNLVDWRALRPGRDHFPYTISKAGLVALTQSTALQLAPRINVNAIALGAILPPVGESEDPNLVKNVPQKRWAELDEFTRTAIFLLEGPEYITGEVIHLDGGRHLV
ncbi:MAG TPA: SDR family oxidoreductase [Anaerolineaceae bacterium]|nr:SDR family oxidoreductase [Anaerolineaceae bacterium]